MKETSLMTTRGLFFLLCGEKDLEIFFLYKMMMDVKLIISLRIFPFELRIKELDTLQH